MSKIYIYVVDRDFGFAPNPFHGYCTLATCKPIIRRQAQVGDWVIGVGGSRLKAPGHCIFAMRVTEKLTFDEYWSNPMFFDKKPVRNGTKKMMVGDNIYHRDSVTNDWHQADSHHSNVDGSINPENLKADTKSESVLISEQFFYFGDKAPIIPYQILNKIGYKNQRGYRVFDNGIASSLIEWLLNSYKRNLNEVLGDPFDFSSSGKRYSGYGSKVV